MTDYKANEIRAKCNTLKAGTNSELQLEIKMTPATFDESLASLGLEGLVLKGKSGQVYWTVGDGAEYDIILAK